MQADRRRTPGVSKVSVAYSCVVRESARTVAYMPETPYIKRRVNGAAVRALREALGIRHMDLAARAEITKGTLTHIESGTRQVSPTTLRKLACGLGVSLEAISYPVAVAA